MCAPHPFLCYYSFCKGGKGGSMGDFGSVRYAHMQEDRSKNGP